MNIKKYNLLWLTFILSAIFISCKKTDTTVGSSLQEKEGIFSHFVLDEINISAGTIIKTDSLYGFSSNELVYVGQYSDNEVGTVKAETYLQVSLGGDGPDFGTNATCDSILLQIAFSSATEEDRVIQGNGSAINSLLIHELNAQVPISTLNSVAVDYGNALDTVTYIAATDTSEVITSRLPVSFGETLLEKAQLKTIDDFKTLFNGIALTSLSTEESIVGFDINDSNSWIRIYYRHDGIGANEDSREYNFDISTLLNHHTHLESDKSSSANFSSISSTLTDNTNTNNQVLLQNGIGASVLLTLEDFIDQIDTTKNILVNKAFIRLPIDPNSFETQFNEAVSFVRIFETDNQGENINNTIAPLITDGSFVVGGTNTTYFFDEDEMYYEIDLTYYFQEYLLGLRPLNSLLITPNLSNATYGVERSLINADEISFKLFYSEL